uniref:Uncharacterized protein n=1 Tax=Lactuca sativa TaxID=4236 RepID=A0A9R1WFM3_LACSA|nr:hypothetical protein LSAT_V11C200100820 [Lactuca sativa]
MDGYGSSAPTRDPETKKKYSPDRYHTFDTGEFKMMSGNYTTIDNHNVSGSVPIQLSKPFPHLEHKARSQALLALPAMSMIHSQSQYLVHKKHNKVVKESKIPSCPLEEASMRKPLVTQTCKLKTGGKIIGFKSRAPIYPGFGILLQIKSECCYYSMNHNHTIRAEPSLVALEASHDQLGALPLGPR